MQSSERDGERRGKGSNDKHEYDVTEKLCEGGAGRIWNSYYRRCLEWEVFGQIEVEMKRSALVWAIRLQVITPVSG